MSLSSERCNIVVLTGAGISAESGLATFRSSEGLWEGHRVDDLHERGGSPQVWHMHGELLQASCLQCQSVMSWDEALAASSKCLKCARVGFLRPNIVWFGEMPFYLAECSIAIDQAHLFVAVGTSGKVYPAAGFVRQAQRAEAHCVEFNLEQSDVSGDFDEERLGPAGTRGPAWVAELLD